MIQNLDLPIDNTVSHLNRATKTVLRESCKITDPNTVTCTTDIYANTAQIKAVQVDTYRVNDGTLTITSQPGVQTGWTPTIGNLYTESAAEARPVTLAQGAPLYDALVRGNDPLLNGATLAQNTIRRADLASDESTVKICSYAPVNENRGFKLCTEFYKSTQSVIATVEPKAVLGGALSQSVSGQFIRSWTSEYGGDDAQFKTFSNKARANGGMAFVDLNKL